ncbi:MAG: hypothetical protein M0R17_04910 [Candidatus Omnitrophica bacterium]|jgi:hypothetical protein|nr:hypothetical protein [Candidatus Omnitrophota bacterium]
MIDIYRINQKLRQEGKVIGYPFYLTSPKLGQFIPSIPKKKAIHITASTNIGKSQYWRYYFLISPYIIYKTYPDSNFKPRWIIFLLEETYEQLYDNLISMFIFIKHKKIVEPGKLRGLIETIITDEELRLVEQVTPLVEDLLSYCTVRDNIYNPTGLYNTCKRELLLRGKRNYTTLIKSDVTISEEEYLKLPPDKQSSFKFKEYIQNDEREYVFIVTDNANLLEPEKENGVTLNLQDTMWKWSTEYAHKQLQKNFGCIILDIIQQMGTSESQQFTNSGSNIIEKTKPTRDGYGDNKRIARNADLILGLFAPTFYGVKNYYGYNLEEIGDFFRTVIILKNRLGRGFKEIPLFFNGAVNYFTELPLNDKITTQERDLIKKGLYYQGFKKLN